MALATDARLARTAPRARPKKDDPYAPFRMSLLSPERVRELSQLRPARAVRDTLLCWAWIVGAWTAVAIWPQWWVVVLAVCVIGISHYGIFILAHDGLHRRLFPKQRDNDLFADLFLLGSIGAITRINNQNHLKHHRLLATEEDPDRHKYICFDKTDMNEMFVYLTGLTGVLKTIKNVFITAVSGQPAPKAGPSVPPYKKRGTGYTVRDLAILVGWQAGLFFGLTFGIAWWAYPVLWLLPVYAFSFLGDNLRSFAEHSQPEADDKGDRHRLITYTSNLPERLLLAPMNMNFHAAHHLWTAIPYYNLPTATREMRQSPLAEGLEWRGSYVGYLYRYFVAMPLTECKTKVSSALASAVPGAR